MTVKPSGNNFVWFESTLAPYVITGLTAELKNYEDNMIESQVSNGDVPKKLRNSRNMWIPQNHWVAGMLSHYVYGANREHWQYDLSYGIDNGMIQYTYYDKGMHYNWHVDSFVNHKNTDHDKLGYRKLSITVQLSDPGEYVGGELEFMDAEQKKWVAPKKKGTVIVFDSRLRHRVTPIVRGTRRSLVGWFNGAAWK